MSSYIIKKVQLEILTEINLTKSKLIKKINLIKSKLIKEINFTKSKLIKEKKSKRHQFNNYNVTTSDLNNFIDLTLLSI